MAIQPAEPVTTSTIKRRMRFFLERTHFGSAISMGIASDPGEDGSVDVAKFITYERMELGLVAAEPLLKLDMHAAQNLMDELWHCGLRPSEGSGSAGSLAATERHLADMQKIAFALLGGEQALTRTERDQSMAPTLTDRVIR